MKKMTEKELQPHLEALNLVYYESSIGPVIKPKKDDKHNCMNAIKLQEIGITLIPEQPEITIENLGKFMAKFGLDKNPFPVAEFWTGSGSVVTDVLVYIDIHENYHDDRCNHYDNVKITDPRWREIGEG